MVSICAAMYNMKISAFFHESLKGKVHPKTCHEGKNTRRYPFTSSSVERGG